VTEHYKVAARALEAAKKLISAGDYKAASAKLDHGIQKLGNEYRAHQFLDDSGQKLSAAAAEEDRGEITIAVNIKRRVLEGRLRMCRTSRLDGGRE
jgi:hypothetical protein